MEPSPLPLFRRVRVRLQLPIALKPRTRAQDERRERTYQSVRRAVRREPSTGRLSCVRFQAGERRHDCPAATVHPCPAPGEPDAAPVPPNPLRAAERTQGLLRLADADVSLARPKA